MITYLDKYHQNRESIDRYIDFIEVTFIHRYQKLQLIKEITRLECENESIRQMDAQSMRSTYSQFDLEIDSKL